MPSVEGRDASIVIPDDAVLDFQGYGLFRYGDPDSDSGKLFKDIKGNATKVIPHWEAYVDKAADWFKANTHRYDGNYPFDRSPHIVKCDRV